MFLIENQVPLIALFFLAGCVGVGFIFRKPAGHRAWQLADLVWVVLGLIGALGAIVAGLYQADSSHVEREIGIAFAAHTRFDQDAGRFQLRYCEAPGPDGLAVLCDRADFLSASVAENADLPLFLAVTERRSALRRLFGGALGEEELAAMADALNPGMLLTFQPLDDTTREALARLQPVAPDIAADYRVLAKGYDTLIARTRRLKQEWEFLQARSWVLLVQILAICLVSFAAPFRLGKSIAELRRP